MAADLGGKVIRGGEGLHLGRDPGLLKNVHTLGIQWNPEENTVKSEAERIQLETD